MKKPERAVWILALFYFLFNLGFLSSQYNFDGTVFSFSLEAVKAGASFGLLLHPRHLLYEPLGYFFWSLLWFLGFKVRAILALEIFDLVLSSLNLALFSLILMRIQPQGKWWAFLFTLGLGFSYGYWFLSVEPEVYLLSVLILNLTFYFMLRGFSGERIFLKAVYLSLLLTLLLFSHLAYSLFLLPGLYFLIKNSPEAGVKKFYPAFLMLALMGIITLGIYFWAFSYNPLAPSFPGTIQEKFLRWLLGLALRETPYGYEQSYWNLSLSAPAQGLAGLWACFYGRKDWLPDLPSWNWLRDGAVLVLIICILAYIYLYFQNWHQRSRAQDLIWFWVIPGILFTTFWEPGNYEHKLYFLPSLWLMAFLGVTEFPSPIFKKSLGGLMVIVVLIIFGSNFQTKILPGADPKNNPELKLSLRVKELSPDHSVIIISGVLSGHILQKIYLPYFAQRNTLVLDWVLSREVAGEKFPTNLERIIYGNLGEGKSVYLLSEIWEGKVLKELSEHHRIKEEALRDFWSQFKLELVEELNGDRIYQIR